MTRVFLNGIYLCFLFACKRNKRLFLSSKKAKFYSIIKSVFFFFQVDCLLPGIQNQSNPSVFPFSGTMVGLKGAILTMALLDATGTLLPPSYEPWYDPNASDEEKEKSRRRRPASPPSSQEGPDSQFAVLCSEKQAKVLAMPSQTRIYKHNITETSFVLRADVVQMAGTNCIACFCANGHIMTLRYNLSPCFKTWPDVRRLCCTEWRLFVSPQFTESEAPAGRELPAADRYAHRQDVLLL